MLLDKNYRSAAPRRLGLLAMLALLALAWHFYLERVAYYDLAFHLFIYLREDRFFIQNRRFVAGITQVVPLLGSRAGWSIDALMRAYSLAFIVYYGAVFVLCARWLRNQQVALVVVLLFTLLAARTFYWAQSELPQSLALLLFFYAGVGRQAPLRRRWSTLALALLVPVCIFGHPLMLLPFLFLWGYDWLLNRRYADAAYYGLLALALATYYWRTATIPPGSYEALRLDTTQLADHLRRLPELASFGEFGALCRGNFVALPAALLVLSGFYLTQRAALGWLRLAWVWAFVAGYTALVCASYPDFVEPGYFENLLLPLAVFVAVPLALEVLPALEARGAGRWAAAGLAVVLAARLGVIYYTHRDYTAYQDWLGRVMAYTRQFPERKFLLDEHNADAHHLRAPSWASAFETALRSARPGADSARTITMTSADEVARLLPVGQQPDIFLMPWVQFHRAEMPLRYVRIPDTPYRSLNTPPPAEPAALDAYLAGLRGGRIELVALPRALRAGRPREVVVRLVPPAGQVLYSGLGGPHPLLLAATFYRDQTWATDQFQPTTPLELDVYGPWAQPIMVDCPPQPGAYTLEIKLISRDYRDTPLRLRLPVEVR